MKLRSQAFLLAFFLAMAHPLAAAPSVASTNTLGQWIWSTQDRSLFLAAKKIYPDLLPGLWIGTLSFSGDEVKSSLALSPSLPKTKGVAVVIRFDESFHQSWDAKTPAEIARQIDLRLSDLLGHAEGSGAEILEIQLDYDCPERRLALWAEVLKDISRSSLKGRRIWITSLIAHLRNASFGDLFRDSVQGHILQVFDTGDSFQNHSPEALVETLAKQKLPFRIGLGAFERGPSPAIQSDHRDWFSALPVFSSNPWYRGLWIFPGGKPWTGLLAYFERKP